MIISETKLRVCYGDTDAMKVVYYGTYARYYEVGRNELIRELGLPYSEMETMGYGLIVSSLQCKYIKPAQYDDLLTIKTLIKELPTVKLTVYTEIYNQHNELINIGTVVLAFVNLQTKKLCRAPQKLNDLIEAKF